MPLASIAKSVTKRIARSYDVPPEASERIGSAVAVPIAIATLDVTYPIIQGTKRAMRESLKISVAQGSMDQNEAKRLVRSVAAVSVASSVLFSDVSDSLDALDLPFNDY